MLLHVFSEERKVGEVQFVGDFFDAFSRLLQQAADVFHDISVDDVRSRFPGCGFAYGRQVFGCDAQSVGIVAYSPFLGIRGGKQLKESVADSLCSIISGRPDMDESVHDVLELIEESLQQGVCHFSLVPVRRAGQFLPKQVVVLAKQFHFFRMQVENRVLLEKQFCLQRIFRKGEQLFHVFRRNIKATDFQVFAGVGVFHNRVGRVNHQFVRVDDVPLPVDAYGACALQA